MPINERDDTILNGKYRIERVIGEGAFGRVYLAFDPRVRRNVAIKELLAGRTQTDRTTYDRYLERFQREAQAAGNIEHPNVVSVHELAIDADENYYLVMQYVDGANLRDLLAQVDTLPLERAVTIATELALALEAVHEQDVVHRDIKPANIMITRRGVTKLTDFGIAQVGHESRRTLLTASHPGTPLYMSPEQSSGYAYVDGRSDLYSLGAVLYEVLVGEPYARKRLPLRATRPDLPVAVWDIVDKLMMADVAQRYQHASEVVDDLRRLPAAPQKLSPDVYQLPHVRETPGSNPGLPVVPVTTGPATDGAEARVAPPPSIVQRPPDPPTYYQAPPPQFAPPYAGVPAPILSAPRLPKCVRIQRDQYGQTQFVVSVGAVFLTALKHTGIAVGAWIVILILDTILTGLFGGVVEDIMTGIAGITLVLLPLVPIVSLIVVRYRAVKARNMMRQSMRQG
jgi:serine/threonine protein kinase